MISDVVSKDAPNKRWTVAIITSAGMCVIFPVAFQLHVGTLQLAMIGLGLFLSAGAIAPTAAIVTTLTPPSVYATVIAVLTLSLNLLGSSPGPFLTGVLADKLTLQGALQVIPLFSVISVVAFVNGARHYNADRKRISE